METQTLALGVATLVVIILLMSCWGQKPRRASRRFAAGRRSGSCPQLKPGYIIKENPNDGSNQISPWGQGVISRELAAQYNQVADAESMDYSSMMQYSSLEPEVFDSQATYSDDIGISNRGASTMTVRSDPNDINPWIGLRRPDYHSVWPASDARTDSTEYADQMFASTHYLL